MTAAFLNTAQRPSSFMMDEQCTTRAAVAEDILRYAPARLSVLSAIVPLLLTALANHDGLTYVHSLRVGQLAWWVTHAQGHAISTCNWTFLAGLLHDIGKIDIPRSLLQKRAPLACEEIDIIHTHAARGAQLLQQYADVAAFAPVVATQYERPDGQGTPKGLQAPEIPPVAYIVAVAEAIDTLAYPVSRALPPPVESIYDVLLAGAGYRWDASVATTAVQVLSDAMRRVRPAWPFP